MGREVTIVVAHGLQMRTQQGEVLRFFYSHLQPVKIIGVWHAAKAPDCVERQVDGIELDVRDGVQQRGQAFGGKGRALGHVEVRAQFGSGGATGQPVGCLKKLVRCY